jgi:hypothetical protein
VGKVPANHSFREHSFRLCNGVDAKVLTKVLTRTQAPCLRRPKAFRSAPLSTDGRCSTCSPFQPVIPEGALRQGEVELPRTGPAEGECRSGDTPREATPDGC